MDNNQNTTQTNATTAVAATEKKPMMKKFGDTMAVHAPRVLDAAIGTAIVVGATVAIKAITATVASNAETTAV